MLDITYYSTLSLDIPTLSLDIHLTRVDFFVQSEAKNKQEIV